MSKSRIFTVLIFNLLVIAQDKEDKSRHKERTLVEQNQGMRTFYY